MSFSHKCLNIARAVEHASNFNRDRFAPVDVQIFSYGPETQRFLGQVASQVADARGCGYGVKARNDFTNHSIRQVWIADFFGVA